MSKVLKLIEEDITRQRNTLVLIPSENYVSKNVLKALGSVLTNKYSEGFPGARYYGGNEIIDKIEIYCQQLANKVFKTDYAIVQPYSGSPANMAVLLTLAGLGGTVLGQSLFAGGHLTHGASASFTSQMFNAVQYGVRNDGRIDMEQVRSLAKIHKPKMIWVGTTAYPYILDYQGFAEIAESIDAWLVADIAHVAGLIAGGVHPSPVKYVDVITTTTHKTLRGPRGGMILITKKGLKKDPQLGKKIEKTVMPGLQGGPHDHQTAAIAVALEEILKPSFKKYAKQVIKNAKVLAKELGGISETHLVLVDLRKYGFGLGYQAQYALELAGITMNRNTVPKEAGSAFYPSGIRMGSPALTSRGMKEKDMVRIAGWIKQVLEEIRRHDLPKEQEKRKDFMKVYKQEMSKNKKLKAIRREVEKFAKKFPVPGVDN
ncbi:serine hydroxymethyltransferase [Patescibacteria group bacterium]|nr:serine hydroxymethyltransferase [Patescibacteria group bacterium]